jgi:hypothetical protein
VRRARRCERKRKPKRERERERETKRERETRKKVEQKSVVRSSSRVQPVFLPPPSIKNICWSFGKKRSFKLSFNCERGTAEARMGPRGEDYRAK